MFKQKIEQFSNNGILLGMVIREDYKNEGINFFTEESMPLQLGYMNREKGYKIQPHTHNHTFCGTLPVHEILFIKSGKVLVQFFLENDDFFTETILEKGDIILLATGGHSFEMLEESEIFEVKQGPYLGIKDKVMIEPTQSPLLQKNYE